MPMPRTELRTAEEGKNNLFMLIIYSYVRCVLALPFHFAVKVSAKRLFLIIFSSLGDVHTHLSLSHESHDIFVI